MAETKTTSELFNPISSSAVLETTPLLSSTVLPEAVGSQEVIIYEVGTASIIELTAPNSTVGEVTTYLASNHPAGTKILVSDSVAGAWDVSPIGVSGVVARTTTTLANTDITSSDVTLEYGTGDAASGNVAINNVSYYDQGSRRYLRVEMSCFQDAEYTLDFGSTIVPTGASIEEMTAYHVGTTVNVGTQTPGLYKISDNQITINRDNGFTGANDIVLNIVLDGAAQGQVLLAGTVVPESLDYLFISSGDGADFISTGTSGQSDGFILFNDTDFDLIDDPNTLIDAAEPSRIVVQKNGRYKVLLTYSVNGQANTDSVVIRKNGSDIVASSRNYEDLGSHETTIIVQFQGNLVAGDYLEFGDTDGTAGTIADVSLSVEQVPNATVVSPDVLTPTTLSRIQTSLSTTVNNSSNAFYTFDETVFSQGSDLSIQTTGNVGSITGLKAGKTYKLSTSLQLSPPGAGVGDSAIFRFVDLTTNAAIGEQFTLYPNASTSIVQSAQSYQEAFFTPIVDSEVGIDFISGTIGELSPSSTFTVEEVPNSTVVAYNPGELEAKALSYFNTYELVNTQQGAGIDGQTFTVNNGDAGVLGDVIFFGDGNVSSGGTLSSNGSDTITVTDTGRYRVWANFGADGVAGNEIYGQVLKNGSIVSEQGVYILTTNDTNAFSTEYVGSFVAGDTIQWAIHGSSAADLQLINYNFTIEQLPTEEVVAPGDVPVEDVEVELVPLTTLGIITTAAPQVFDTGLGDLATAFADYERIRFEVSSGGFFDEKEVPLDILTSTYLGANVQLYFHGVSSGNFNMWIEGWETTNPGEIEVNGNPGGQLSSPQIRIVGIKAQKTVIAYNPADLEAKTLDRFMRSTSATVASTLWDTVDTPLDATILDQVDTSPSTDSIVDNGDGTVTLKAGQSYKLEAQALWNVDGLTATNDTLYRWYDDTNAAYVGAIGASHSRSDSGGGFAPAVHYTGVLAADTTFSVRNNQVDISGNEFLAGTKIIVEMLPTEEVVTPGDVPIEDVEVSLIPRVTGQGGISQTNLANGATWDDVIADYEYIKLAIYNETNDYGDTVSIKTVDLVEGSSKFSGVHDGNAWELNITGNFNTNGGLIVTADAAGATFTYELIGVKPQKTVINTTDTPTDDQTTSGYFDIGNMRIQWGNSVGSTTITFPAPFADTSYAITGNTNSVTSTVEQYSVQFVSRTTTSFSANVVQQTSGSPTTGAFGYGWHAIGLKP